MELSKKDIIRFAEYDLKLYARYKTDIHTVVFCVNKVNEKNTKFDCRSLKYSINAVDLSEKNGDDKLRELREKIENKKEINELELIFLPLMRSRLEKVNLVREAVKLEMQLSKEDDLKEKLVAITLVMADKLVRREELERIWEDIRMFKFIEFAEGKGIEKGMEKGIEKGMEKGKLDVAANMLIDGESEEKIKKYTGLSDEQIEKVKEYIKSQGTH